MRKVLSAPKGILLIGALSLGLMALLLVGCGADPTSTPVPTKAPAQPQAPAPAATAVPDAPVTGATTGPAATATAPPQFFATPVPVTPTVMPLVTVKPEGTLSIMAAEVTPIQGIPSALGAPGDSFAKLAFDSFTNTDVQLNILPGAAERWEIDPAASTLTFFLTKGVQFHDGWGEVTASDVEWAINDVKSPKSINRNITPYQGISKIEIVDTHTIVLTLPPANMLEIIGFAGNNGQNFPLIIPSRKYVESVGEAEAGRNWIGAGPWQHTETSEGEFVKFKANEDFYRKVPDFAFLEIREIPEESIQLAALRTGEGDMMLVGGNFLPEVRRAGLEVIKGRSGGWSWIMLTGQYLPERAGPDVDACEGKGVEEGVEVCGHFNPNTNPDGIPWVGDPTDPDSMERALKVRKALNMAVDLEELAETVFFGSARLDGVPGYVRGSVWDDPAWTLYDLDRVEARRLLDETGGPFEMDLIIRTGRPAMEQASEAIARWWEEIGMKVNRRPESRGVTRPFQVDRTLGTDKPVAYTSGCSFRVEPWLCHGNTLSFGDTLNIGEARIIDDLYAKAGRTFDTAERIEVAQELGQFLYDQYMGVWVVAQLNNYAVGPEIASYEDVPGSDWKYLETVVRKK